MKQKFIDLLKKYISIAPREINDTEPIVEVSYPALLETSILGEKFTSKLIKEVREKCGELGYEIDHVVFFSAFDGPVIFNQKHIKGDSDDYLAIFRREDESCFAAIFIGAWLQAK